MRIEIHISREAEHKFRFFYFLGIDQQEIIMMRSFENGFGVDIQFERKRLGIIENCNGIGASKIHVVLPPRILIRRSLKSLLDNTLSKSADQSLAMVTLWNVIGMEIGVPESFIYIEGKGKGKGMGSWR